MLSRCLAWRFLAFPCISWRFLREKIWLRFGTTSSACRLQEKYITANKLFNFACVDLEKAFGLMVGHKEPRIDESAVRVIQGMYSNARCYAPVEGQYSMEFGVGVGLHRSSLLSRLLFILEVLLREFIIVVSLELLCADDLVLITDTKEEECICKLQALRVGIENKGPLVNRNKTKFLASGFGHDGLNNLVSTTLLSAVMWTTTSSIAQIAWISSTKSAVASLSDWWPNETLFAAGVIASLVPCMAELSLKRMSMTPCLMWRSLPAAYVIWGTPLWAVAVTLLPDVVWHGESSRNWIWMDGWTRFVYTILSGWFCVRRAPECTKCTRLNTGSVIRFHETLSTIFDDVLCLRRVYPK